MKVEANAVVDAPIEKVWNVVTDIKNAAATIEGIEKIEVLEEPESGLVGLKWRETRKMYGKEATEVMWITDAQPNKFYMTRAESHGSIYKSGLSVQDADGKTRITQTFEAEAVSFGAKLANVTMGWMMKGSIRKAFDKDLQDIKKAVEAK